MSDIHQARSEGVAFAKQHAVSLAAEINEWQDTGLLRGSRLNELAEIVRSFSGAHALQTAEQMANRAARDALSAAGEAMVIAWVHESDPHRVISASQKAASLRDGGASASSVRLFSVPAYGAAPTAPAPEAGMVDADALRIECGASPEEWADFKRWRHAQRGAMLKAAKQGERS